MEFTHTVIPVGHVILVGHFSNKSFQVIDCTGTDKLAVINAENTKTRLKHSAGAILNEPPRPKEQEFTVNFLTTFL